MIFDSIKGLLKEIENDEVDLIECCTELLEKKHYFRSEPNGRLSLPNPLMGIGDAAYLMSDGHKEKYLAMLAREIDGLTETIADNKRVCSSYGAPGLDVEDVRDLADKCFRDSFSSCDYIVEGGDF